MTVHYLEKLNCAECCVTFQKAWPHSVIISEMYIQTKFWKDYARRAISAMLLRLDALYRSPRLVTKSCNNFCGRGQEKFPDTVSTRAIDKASPSCHHGCFASLWLI